MADNLPAPESRVESYLAKAAGEDVTIPEKPLSRLEQYLDAIAEGGGGGGAGPTVVQTPGTSTTDVMSQNATTSMVFADPSTRTRVRIGSDDSSMADSAIAIGSGAIARGEGSVSIGTNSTSDENGDYSVAIGNAAEAVLPDSVAIGRNAVTNRIGEVNVGAGISGRGFNGSNFRVIGGVHDPQLGKDAANKDYVDRHSPFTNIEEIDRNFDSTDPTNTDPFLENCDSWALWKLAGEFKFLTYTRNVGELIYLTGGQSPERISDLSPDMAANGLILLGYQNGLASYTIYTPIGADSRERIDPSTGEPT